MGRLILEGVEALTGGGDTKPLVGHRIEWDLGAGDEVVPGHHVLVNATVDPSRFWVMNDELCVGDSLDKATPYTAGDYVLYEVATVPTRDDEDTLPFHALYKRVVDEAARPGEESWKRAKANMLALWQALALSPDLTAGQRDALANKYMGEMKSLHSVANQVQDMGPAQGPSPDTGKVLDGAVKVLDL
ncbi:MAG: hypothetical protein C0467_27615 [Planctomycetaceae bacterium]|nr:hypothetical protein [Planctomycetaceae bacterium]